MDSVNLYYEVARGKIDAQWEMSTQYRTRVIQLTGLATNILVVSALVVTVRQDMSDPSAWFWVTGSALIFFASAAICYGLSALIPRNWHSGPSLEHLADWIHKRSGTALTECVANSFKRAENMNRQTLVKLHRLAALTLIFLAFETFAFLGLTVTRYL